MRKLFAFSVLVIILVLAIAGVNGALAEKPVATIKIFHHMGENAKSTTLKVLCDAFSKANPDMKFEVESVDYANYPALLRTKIAAGDSPDLIFGVPTAYPELVEAGKIMDLTGQDFLKNIDGAALTAATIIKKIYGIPLDLSAKGFFFNKDLFVKAGAKIPQTEAEFNTLMKLLKAKGITAFSTAYKDGWPLQVEFEVEMDRLRLAKPTTSDDLMSRKLKWNSSDLRAMWERINRRLHYGVPDMMSKDFGSSTSMLASGQAAMLCQGSWAISEIRSKNPKGSFGFFANPAFAKKPSDTLLQVGVDDCFMIGAQTKAKEAALKFVAFLTTKESSALWAKEVKTIPAIKGVIVDQADPMLAEIIDYINAGITFARPGTEFTGQFRDAYAKKLSEFAADPNRSVTKCLTQLDKEYDAIAAASK